ncbi:hypothetical protein SSP35_04_04340 [Streptomyces sp. NBRC 110611]|uniref:hypothetical protein n=1 Tax=Streptomyces sp. NBRC 110611 TaxID=1621259 RepID=UPI000833BB97|nr:hypothetical protein [Streptomyces sp. NBRC 110611]GAU67346.1 hypothetical protein SSP35_04_04340 [Streptomyces sp. NBRC 110611]
MRRLIVVPTVLLGLAASACGAAGEGEGPAAGSPSGGSGTVPDPQRSDPGTDGSPAVPGQPVGCGEIKGALGAAGDVSLYADPGADGTVECPEARDVMTEFFLRAPPGSGGGPAELSVRGWLCRYDSGPTGTWITACRSGRREMHTEQPAGPDAPDDSGSQLPTLPGEPSLPMDEPSTEEL